MRIDVDLPFKRLGPAARAAAPVRHLDRHTSSSLFESTHRHRVLTLLCAIECRQQLPAFSYEPRNLGMPDVAKHFRGAR